MDSQSVLQKLEEAAKVLLAPPNLVTKDQRRQAESIFLEFRKFSFPYETCRFILEHSRNEFAQFQAACTIKSSIVREWAALPAADVEQLRLFLLQYVTSHLSLLSYVREEIFQTIAVIVKRGILEAGTQARDKIFNEVTQLISTGDMSMQLIACSLLTALLNEFSSQSKSSGTGFTWDFHIRCKRHFEENHLHQALLFTLQVLNELVKLETPFGREQLPVMMRFLSIAEQILQWEFLPARLTRRHMSPFGCINQAPFSPPPTWRATVLNPEFLDLFFKLYSKVHYHSDLSHHAVQCLVQLSSLNGRIFTNEASQREYLTNYLVIHERTTGGLVLQDYDAIGIATVYDNVFRWFKMEFFQKPDRNKPDSAIAYWDFLRRMAHVTCDFIAKMSSANESNSDDSLYDEALEKILGSWTAFFTFDTTVGQPQFRRHAVEIFNAYVDAHIHKGSEETSGAGSQEYEAEDIPDKEKYLDQLTNIGIISREVIEHTLPSLARVIDSRTEMLKIELEKLIGQSNPATTNGKLDNIYDDLHWLVLIATSVLTDAETSGEAALIPKPILTYSISQANHIDAQETQNLIVQPELGSAQASRTGCKVDAAVRLVSSILRLFYIQSIAAVNNLAHSLSPQLDSTCMYFMKRFTRAYLMLKESNYEQVSLTLQSVFGKDSPGSNCFINLLLDKIKLNLSVWNSEPEVVDESLGVLLSLVSSRNMCSLVIKSSHFSTLISCISENSFPFNSLPASSRRLLYQSVVHCASSMGDHKAEYWQRMVEKPMADFCKMVSSSTFKKDKEEAATRESIIHFLEMLIGCCQACRIDNRKQLFKVLQPPVHATVYILDTCHSDEQLVELCLEVFCITASHMMCMLDNTDSEIFCRYSMEAVNAFVRHNPPGTKKAGVGAEEERFRDIVLILELLYNLLTKDLIDFGDDGTGDSNTLSATEIALAGVNVLLPLIDASLLQFPNLCSQYYKLLTFVSELRPDKVLEYPSQVLELILSSILLSLNGRYGSDVAKNGFEFLTELAMYVAKSRSIEMVAKSKLDNFLQPLLNMLLFEPFDIDLCDIISGALYYLIVLYPAKYHELQSIILEEQKGKPHYDLLLQCLTKLSTDAVAPTSSNSRKEKLKFMGTVNQALLEVKGFLCLV